MAAAICDSRRKRARAFGSSLNSGETILSATLPPEAGLLGEVHDAHAATADDGLDAVRPEVGAEAGVGATDRHGLISSR